MTELGTEQGGPPRTLRFDLSGIGVRVAGLPPVLARRLEREWHRFATERLAVAAALEITRGSPDTDTRFASSTRAKGMRAELAADRARFSTEAGRAEVDAHGRVRLELSGRDDEERFVTLTNLLRATLAWRLPSLDAGLLHAAGLVLDGQAFVLPGAAGAGKSTWAALGEAAGGHVVSDDLVLVQGSGGRLELLGAPFRSTHRTRPRPGRWQVAAILFPRHGPAPRCDPVTPLLAQARLTANLTFVAAALDVDSRLGPLVDRWVERVPCAELTFARDLRFVELLRERFLRR